jgi:hypothetical protein
MATQILPDEKNAVKQFCAHVKQSKLPELTDDDRRRGRETRAKQLEAWSRLDLRQKWADETYMRSFLTKHGIRIPSDLEPATVPRIRTLLRRGGIAPKQAEQAVAGSLARYLQANPRLPLWAATALLVEAVVT